MNEGVSGGDWGGGEAHVLMGEAEDQPHISRECTKPSVLGTLSCCLEERRK